MYLKKIFFIVCLSTTAIKGNAQLSGGLESNSSWYIDDKKIKLEQIEAEDRLRTNTYLRLDYRLKNFTAGVQAEAYDSKALLNYSPNFKGTNLGTYYGGHN